MQITNSKTKDMLLELRDGFQFSAVGSTFQAIAVDIHDARDISFVDCLIDQRNASPVRSGVFSKAAVRATTSAGSTMLSRETFVLDGVK